IAGLLYSKMFHLGSAAYFHEWINHKGIVEFICGIAFLFILLVIEFLIGDKTIEKIVSEKAKPIRWIIYILLTLAITWFGVYNNTSFVYFQY
ncbi:MAG: hypothetical protein KDC60_05100, partial [Bacteroidetes bacterium]|nr:hypothetical protein [Bacteroidota bacterium]